MAAMYSLGRTARAGTWIHRTEQRVQVVCSSIQFNLASNWRSRAAVKGGWHGRVTVECDSSFLASSARLSSAPCSATSESAAVLASSDGCTLVWFKNDLRLDDHPAVAAAAKSKGRVAFVYCFDPDVLAPLLVYPGAVKVLLYVVKQLQQQLRAAGSDLITRVGSWTDVIPELAASLGATTILTQEEVDSSTQQLVKAIQAQLSQQGVTIQTWDVSAWDRAALKPNFRTWKKSRPTAQAPISPPSVLPVVPDDILTGELPTIEALYALLGQAGLQESNKQLLEAAEKVAATAQVAGASREADVLERTGVSSLQLLDLYLRQDNTQNGGDSLRQQIAAEIAASESPAAEGGAFVGLMGWQMRFGALSRRRVLEKAEQAGKGRPRYAGPATPWVAAATAAERSEFHHQLLSCEATVKGSLPAGDTHLKPAAWWWRNQLADYCEGHPPGGPHPESPAVLLLHGFGAFGTHWRFNVEPLTAKGYHVYAPTLPGFGRTEKAAVQYSQELWSSYLRDFVLLKVKKPVVLAGNSIGGFIASNFAAEYPELVSGLVLVNSAGPIDASFTQEQWAKSVRTPPPAWVAYAISAGLFFYLERTVKGTLKWLYPRNPSNADAWLSEEIVRAAADSGSLDVFKAVFYLPPPKALNYLVKDQYGGPTLVLQGAEDPLNDAVARANQLVDLCPNATKKLIPAGHCPHDELPEVFNAALLEFLEQIKPDGPLTSTDITASKLVVDS